MEIDDDDDERESIIEEISAEIKKLQSEISKNKEEMYHLYENNNEEQFQLVKHLREVDREDVPPISTHYISVLSNEICCYAPIIRLRRVDKFKNIFIEFPKNRLHESYSLRFKMNEEGLYDLIQASMPYSLKPLEEKVKARNTDYDHLPTYVRSVQSNIYAFQIRQKQLRRFLEVYNKTQIYITYTPCLTRITLSFCMIYNEERLRIKLTLIYTLNHIRPRALCIDNDEINDETNRDLLVLFEPFENCDLNEAYLEIFQNQKMFA